MADIKRTELLKSYLKRLGSGEDLEAVRADFKEQFQEVDAMEIMKAEQSMIAEGTPITEVQKLCDLHSALFHGATREEKIANAEIAVAKSMKAASAPQPFPMPPVSGANYGNKKEEAARLEAIKGHPLQTFTRENEELKALIAEANAVLADGGDVLPLLVKIREVSIHYAKKGDLLYPLLKTRYEVTGPSAVMWTNDDEIRDDMGRLVRKPEGDDEWKEAVKGVIKRADEMIFKDQNILFPICAVNFTEEEWMGIYRDAKDYAPAFGVESEVWEEAEEYLKQERAEKEKKSGLTDAALAGEVVMPGGHMTVAQLTALLNTLPVEITFIDDQNINRYFNEGPKVFKRPEMAIDREVFSCHPPKIEPMVRKILDDFRNNRRDVVPVWMEKNGRTMLVRYMAVRDNDGNYVGTVEAVEDMEFAKEHFVK